MIESRFLILGEMQHVKHWVRMNKISPTRWVHIDQNGDRLQGLEGPYRNEASPWILIQLHCPIGYYHPYVFEFLQVMGFRL